MSTRNQGHIEIRPSDDQFVVRLVAENGEIIHSSERLHARESAIRNAKAALNLFGGDVVLVKDYSTGEGVQHFYLDKDGGIDTQVLP